MSIYVRYNNTNYTSYFDQQNRQIQISSYDFNQEFRPHFILYIIVIKSRSDQWENEQI